VAPRPGILIVDDESVPRLYLAGALRAAGYEAVTACASLTEARTALQRGTFAALFLDLGLPDGDGETFLAELSASHPELPVIVITGSDDAATAVRCMRAHAIDYLVKPIDLDVLLAALRRTLTAHELGMQSRQYGRMAITSGPAHPEAFTGMLTADPDVHRLMLYAEIVAPGSQAVLITGETGTGKELMAKAVHRLSGRRGPFVAVNVAGLDDTMFSDTLFGHRRGAFTGAAGDRPGLVHQAENGTLFLDEIGELAETAQVKLLRLLQENEYYPLGSDQPRRSTARVVAATHRDPERHVADGRLRRDLYYRLHAHHIHLPPLRERRGDIPLLLHHFATAAADDLNLPVPPIESAVVRAAQANPWPGNVRELAAVVHDAVGRGRGLSLEPARFGPPARDERPALVFPDPLPTVDEVREQLIAEALRRTHGDLVAASQLLGMSRWGLSKHLRAPGSAGFSLPGQ
jgi:DNA-binding NtrC family response regulator